MCSSAVKHEGACCIQNSYLEDGAQCVLMPSASACAFRGGVWRGKHSNCDMPDFTCGPLTGVCCVDGVAYDDQTASECQRCHGTFAGPGSSSGDEGVCDVKHRGACCKKLHGCEDSTYAQCKRSGGNFQGPGSTCQDHGICTACAPCQADGDACQSDEDCADESVCVAKFGKCMVAASRIHQKRLWNPTMHSRAMRMGTAPLAKPTYSSVAKKQEHNEEENSDSSSDSDDSDSEGPESWHDRENEIPDGPFSCGSVDTIGQPCIIHPCQGKCAIGTCQAPPPNTVSNGCASVCMRIREYECGCECRDPWWETCAFISGAVYNDTDLNQQTDTLIDTLFTATPIIVTLFSIPSSGDEAVLVGEKTSDDGRFAFSGLPGGEYSVLIGVPNGYHINDGLPSLRLVTVRCLPEGEATPTNNLKRSIDEAPKSGGSTGVHSQVLTVINNKALSEHIVDNLYFLIAPGQGSGNGGDGQNGGVDQEATPLGSSGSGGNSISGTVIAIIVIAVVLGCLGLAVFGYMSRRRVARMQTAQALNARIVQTRSVSSSGVPLRRN